MSNSLESRPPVTLTKSDAAVLERVAMNALFSSPRLAGPLIGEVDRARIVADGALPGDVAGLGSTVTFLDVETGVRRAVVITLPGEDDAAAGRVSVLSSLGAGLIGLRAGADIIWPDHLGGRSWLRLVKVDPPQHAQSS